MTQAEQLKASGEFLEGAFLLKARLKRGPSLSLAERAFWVIKRRILDCDLRPGTMVNSVALAKELGMSRSPVQEALKGLCGEDLLEVMPQVGFVIRPVTVQDVQEVFQLRINLECLAVELVTTRATQKQLDDLERLAFVPPEAFEGISDLGKTAWYQNQFHVCIAMMSGNSSLLKTLGGLIEKTHRMLILLLESLQEPQGWGKPPEEHVRILNLILARDREGAVKAMASHIRASRRLILDVLAPLPIPYRPMHEDDLISTKV